MRTSELRGSKRATALLRVAAAVMVISLGAGACGSNSSTPAGEGAEKGAAKQTKGGARAAVTLATDSQPRYGGRLVYGLEAETDGFNPVKNRWAISGTMIGLTVFDPLVAFDADQKPQPYLAASFTPSSDFKTWTFKLRPNVKFHDGTPLTAAAVKKVYDAHKQSGLTGAAFTPLERTEVVDELTVEFHMSSPWAAFPASLTGQGGVIPAPAQLDDQENSTTRPIGTGPFKFVSWNGPIYVGEKNPDYWRPGLPYLDAVEFRAIPENQSRMSSLLAGQLHMFHTTNGPTIIDIRKRADAGEIQVVEDLGETEEGFVMLNTSKPPFDDVRARRAVAYAIDRQAYIDAVGEGVNRAADSVFTPNTPWYLADNGYPEYDPATAQELVDEIKREKGSFSFRLQGGGVDSRNALSFLQQAFQNVGMDVEVETIEQSRYIVEALAGNYQANLWRQFGSPDPDFDYIWWISDNADDQLALNIARHANPDIDAALKKGRENPDPEVRREAYAELQRKFSELVPYAWLDHATWAIAANNKVRGIVNGPLPDGQPSYPIGGSGGFPGVHRLTQVWIAE
ncbi:MAG: ABC transporter substrate-binding protein [Acidimicrobiales bacterium]|nr:ABC transporter substrate-binding protein [Acidimicrobiales bacterium]